MKKIQKGLTHIFLTVEQHRRKLIRLILALLLFQPNFAAGFALIDKEGDGDLADLLDRPSQFMRINKQNITWKMDNSFRAAWTDNYARYLVRETIRDLENEAFSILQGSPLHSYRKTSDPAAIHDLRTVLIHEVGHTLGLQHSDAAAYNESAMNAPAAYDLNWTFGPIFGVGPWTTGTFGSEIMNEGHSNTPGVKGPKGIKPGEYNRVLSWDESLALIWAYSPSFPSFTEVGPNDDADLVLSAYSNPGNGNLGQGGPDFSERINPSDVSEGWNITATSLKLNAGYDMGYNTRKRLFSYINLQPSQLKEIRLLIRGTSTDEPVSAGSNGAYAFQKGVRIGHDPDFELANYIFSEPKNGGVPTGSQVNFELELDVDDWVLVSVFGRNNTGEFEIPFIELEPTTPPGKYAPVAPGIPDGTLPEELETLNDYKFSISAAKDLPLIAKEPSVKITATGEQLSEVSVIEIFQLDEDHVINGDRVKTGEIDQMAKRGERYVLTLNRPFVQGEVAEYLFTEFEFDEKGNSRHSSEPIEGPSAFRVTIPSEAGVLKITTLASIPQGLPSHDSLCSVYATRESCCGNSPTSISLGATSAFVGEVGDACVVSGKDNDIMVSVAAKGQTQRIGLGAGDDSFRSGPGLARVFGGDGDDVIQADVDGRLITNGGDGDDTLLGARGIDMLYGGRGADQLSGGSGEDVLYGGPGLDVIKGGPGNDEIFPGSGTDQVYAGDGDDRVVLNTCAEEDTKLLDGGPGYDVLVVPSTLDAIIQTGTRIESFEQFIEGGSFGLDECRLSAH